jgi:hypothetical protein
MVKRTTSNDSSVWVVSWKGLVCELYCIVIGWQSIVAVRDPLHSYPIKAVNDTREQVQGGENHERAFRID